MHKYPVLTLKSGRQRAVLNRHPWIFSGAVKRLPKANHGDIVAVESTQGELLAFGHYAPESKIVCRLFHFGSLEGDIDSGYWHAKFQAAVDYRNSLKGAGQYSGYRLFNAEGDNLPGIIADVFGDTASLQLRTSGAMQLEEEVSGFLTNELGIKHIYASRAEGKNTSGDWLTEAPESVVFEEYGVKYHADITGGQKTGFFLDQRENRKLVREYARGKRVLDVFCYSGGFSVNALKGEAAQVVSVDISAGALDLVRANAELNGVADARHDCIKADAFQYLREMPEDTFDLVVLDPPAFTKSIRTVERAARGYKDINLKAMQRMPAGSLLFTYSCSQHMSTDLFRKVVFGAAADAGREVRIIDQMTQAPDHPVNIFHPEGEYLKGLLLYVD